jgi:tetratricopeptide (TPR) repeat protein
MMRRTAFAIAVAVICALAVALPSRAAAQAPPPPAGTAVVPLTDAQQALLAAVLAAETDAARDAAIADAEGLLAVPVFAAAFEAGMARRRAADTEGSTAAFRAARVLAASLHLPRDEARTWMQLAQNASRSGRFDDASQALDAAERLATAANDQPMRAAIVGNRGIIARMRGDFDLASRHYEEAVRLSGELGQPGMQASALNNLGIVHMQRGDYAAALNALERSQAMTPQSDLTRARALGNMAVIYGIQGDHDLAIAAHERAIALLGGLGEEAETGVPLLGLGVTLRDAQRLDDALASFGRAEAILRRAKNTFELQTLFLERGQAHLASGRIAEADADFSAALALSREMDEKAGMASAHIMLAETQLAQGRLEPALASARAGLDLARTIGSRIVVDDGWAVYGRVLGRMGRVDDARLAFDASIDEIEQQRATVAGDEAVRSRFLADRVRPYHDVIDLLDRAGQGDLATAYADRARARALVDVLTRGRVDVSAALTPDEQREETRLEQRLAEAQRDIVASGSPGSLGGNAAAPSVAVGEARRALSAFRARVVARYPQLRLTQGDSRLVQLADLAPLVDASTVVVAFSVLPARTRVTVLSRGSAGAPVRSSTYDMLLPQAQLARDVAAFRGGIASRDLGVAVQARAWFTRLLGGAATSLARATRLIVVPDGDLWDLPFQALQDAGGRFLIERMSVSYAPSLAALLELARRPPTPAVSGSEPRVALAAFGNPSPVAGGGLPLPEAARQVAAIARLYPASEVHVATGADVTEAALEAWAPRARVLHLSTHGLLDEASPMYSWLALSAEPRGAADDGRFEAREMVRLPLHAELVVLSACESARGSVAAGEGMIGLAWATLVAGARNVVVSQWKVDAVATEQLMVSFHRRLAAPATARGASQVELAAALRGASLELLRQAETRHPFYWAGFTLVGAGRMAPDAVAAPVPMPAR